MDKPTDSRQQHMVTPNTTDDESITTSTASDTFDSWTLVTDKKIPKPTEPIYEDESNVEDLPKYEDLDLETSQSNAKEEQENETSPDHHADTQSATDEFSDEVSIISESESGDVLTPHPYLHEHLHTLNLKFTTGEGLDLASLLQQQQQEEHRLQQRHEQKQTTPPNTPTEFQHFSNNNKNGTRQRKRRSPSVDGTQKTLKTQPASPVPMNNQPPCTIQPTLVIRRVYTLFFYSIVVLIAVGLYGKLGYWSTFSGDSSNSINFLEKKLIDMELQNNLMRAEIDLLSKQVNYLRTNSERNDKKYQAYKEKKPYQNQEETWKTNENVIEKDKVVKEKSENARESPPNTENIYDSNTAKPMETKAPDLTESKSTIPVIEKPLEQPKLDENPSMKYYQNNDYIMKERFNKHNSKENRDFPSKNEEKFQKRDEKPDNFKRQNKKQGSKELYDDDKTEEHKNFKMSSKEKDNSNERKYKKDENEFKRKNNNNDDSKENYYKNNNSKECKYKKSDKDDDDSKERYYKNKNFKENQQQKRRKSKTNSDERFDNDKNSGEWHEKLMKQREKARHEREEYLNREKNWYLNRNDGREQWRNDEIHRR